MGCYPFPLPEGPNDDVSKAHRRTTLQQRDTSYVGSSTNTTRLHPNWIGTHAFAGQRCCTRLLPQEVAKQSCLALTPGCHARYGSSTGLTHPPPTLGLPEPHVPIEGWALKCCSSKTGPEATCEHSRYMEICVYVYT